MSWRVTRTSVSHEPSTCSWPGRMLRGSSPSTPTLGPNRAPSPPSWPRRRCDLALLWWCPGCCDPTTRPSTRCTRFPASGSPSSTPWAAGAGCRGRSWQVATLRVRGGATAPRRWTGRWERRGYCHGPPSTSSAASTSASSCTSKTWSGAPGHGPADGRCGSNQPRSSATSATPRASTDSATAGWHSRRRTSASTCVSRWGHERPSPSGACRRSPVCASSWRHPARRHHRGCAVAVPGEDPLRDSSPRHRSGTRPGSLDVKPALEDGASHRSAASVDSPGEATGPRVSVVVPTHGRVDRLGRLLGALGASRTCRQTSSRSSWWTTPHRTGPAQSWPRPKRRARLPLHVLTQPVCRGPAAARNLGWRSTRAAVIAFTDDDCVPDPGWLRAGLAALDGRARVAVGRTMPPADQLHLVGAPFSRVMEVDSVRFFETCNVFYRRDDLVAAGGFDERFRRPGGEDTRWAST